MKKIASAEARRSFLLGFIVLGLVAAIIFLPSQFRSQAGNTNENRNVSSGRTVSHQEGIENYDIRTDKNKADALVEFRQMSGRDAVAVADARDRFVAGENALRRTVPTLKVEYNDDIRTPEAIGPDVNQGRAFLTAPSTAKHSDILRGFVADNGELIGVNRGQAAALKATADYVNPDGNLSYAVLEQTINDIPVFRGEVKAGFTKNGEMFRVINNLAPALDYTSLSTDFRNPLDAVKTALANIKYELNDSDLARNDAASTDLKTVFGQGDWATTAEKMYFPTEPGVARAAWRVLVWEPVCAYYVIVDAETGTVLWRKNLTADQTQAATFSVYANPNSMMNVAESPSPITPGPLDPGLGTQGTQIARTTVTLIGNEGANSFNNLGWITDGANGVNGWTDGNNVEAGLDIVTPNGVDAPTAGVNRVFNFPFNPPPGMPAPPDDLTTANSRAGAVTQLFYINNRYHDELYKLGFTEQARNYQNDNFGRGGIAGDRVTAEAQDSSGTNNANFSIAADGVRGRMQMYRFTQTPGRDGDLDGDVVVHEHTHGLSQRLIGNGAGLGNNRGGSMGEGWSDFYGLALLSEASDPINALYTTGAYVTNNVIGIGNTNSYYGIRRFPYAVKSFTGGASNRPYNPLTFADVNSGCVLTDGAFPPSPPFAPNACNEVHNAGEVWAIALWEVRAKFVTRLGWAVGNKKTLQLVTDGMKLTQNSPNFVQARDAILSAAQASAVAPDAGIDVSDVWAGFAIRGLGFGAADTGTLATESFASPNAVVTDPFSVSDSTGDNDGFPEPGENVLLSVAVTNTSGGTVNNVVASVTGGGSANYGSITNGSTVTRQISYTIPTTSACGSIQQVSITVTTDIGTQTPNIKSFTLGVPTFSGSTQNFDGVTAPALPAAWTKSQSGSNTGWVTTTTNAVSAPNALFSPDPATSGYAEVEASATVTSASAQLAFKNRYSTESGFDGTVLDIKIGSGAYQDIVTAGGSFVSGGYSGTISAGAGTPISGRQAWTGTAGAAGLDTVVNLPAAANGQTINLKWRTASDTSVAGLGTWYDNVQLTGGSFLSGYNCSLAPSSKARADFDGDGKTDLSVFRASEGNWYLNRSTAGFTGVSWGANGDKLVPGDFDGDGKTDVAVARPSGGVLTFYVLNSGNATQTTLQWGAATDIPVVGDYDGDGKADIAVFRPSNGGWYIRNSNGGTTTSVAFGQSGDVPVANDFDGDGKTDVAVYRGGTWYIQRSQLGFTGIGFGLGTDKPVPADYDGDGKCDIAVYRDGTWYLQRSNLGFTGVAFGAAADVPVPGDYDGDGKYDVAVFRSGTWYAIRSTAGSLTAAFGVGSDLPIPSKYIP